MRKFFLSGILTPLLFLASCSDSDSLSGIQDVFQNGKQPVQSFTVNGLTGGTIVGEDGIAVIFPPGAFVTYSGQAITGIVDVTLQEFLHPGDMIFSKMLPVYNGFPMRSGGEFIITASQDGEKLRLAPGMLARIKVPQSPPVNNNGMYIFWGTISEEETNNVTWNPVQDSSATAYLVFSGDTIEMFTDSLGVCNIDAIIANPQFISFHLNIEGLPPGDHDANIRGYAIFDQYMAVTNMYSSVNHVINETHLVSEPMKLAVMAVVDGTFYANTLSLTPQDDGQYTITLVKSDIYEFKESLN